MPPHPNHSFVLPRMLDFLTFQTRLCLKVITMKNYTLPSLFCHIFYLPGDFLGGKYQQRCKLQLHWGVSWCIVFASYWRPYLFWGWGIALPNFVLSFCYYQRSCVSIKWNSTIVNLALQPGLSRRHGGRSEDELSIKKVPNHFFFKLLESKDINDM